MNEVEATNAFKDAVKLLCTFYANLCDEDQCARLATTTVWIEMEDSIYGGHSETYCDRHAPAGAELLDKDLVLATRKVNAALERMRLLDKSKR